MLLNDDINIMTMLEYDFKLKLRTKFNPKVRVIVLYDEIFERVITTLKYKDMKCEDFYWWGDKDKITRDYLNVVAKNIRAIVKEISISESASKNLGDLHQITLNELGLEEVT